MNRIVLILGCGHWTLGPQRTLGTLVRCERCGRQSQLVGEASPHQLIATTKSAS